MKYILYIGILAFLTNSCTKEVEIDIPGYKDQLVIDGRIETGMPPLVFVSRSKDVYAPTNLDSFLSGFVSGAVVTVSNGNKTVQLEEICSNNLPQGTEEMVASMFGLTVSELANINLCAYTTFDTDIWGEIGKSYDLSVTFDGKTYTSTTTILPPTALTELYWKEEPPTPGYGFSWARLNDPLGQYDAYMWEVRRINTGIDGNPIDAGFTPTFNPVFDDDFFDGKNFEFLYENPTVWNDPNVPDEFKGLYKLGDTVVIRLSKLDRYAFEFLEKKYVQMSSAGNPFATPINLPTNITGGALGVWAGFSPSFDTLICQP
jgi:hypothetical protein